MTMERPHVRIRAGRGWFDVDWKEVWSYRELLMLLVRRDVSVTYKQTILGPAWFLIQPVLMSLVFAVIFGRVANIPTDGLPRLVFYMSGLLSWNYFRGVMEGAGQSFTNYKPLFSKVYFPRLIAPFSLVLSNLVYLALNTAVFCGILCWYWARGEAGMRPNAWLLLLPLVVAYIAACALGCGLWVAALTAKYRDLRFALPFILQVWMYSTPIIYPLSGVREPLFRAVLALNPLTAATEAVRFMFTGHGGPTAQGLALGACTGLAVLALGIGLFNRVQRDFVDTI